MPIYEYRCQSCGHELEKLQRMSDPVLTDCPECGTDQLRRLISAAGFRLKGSGWYETDFKQGNKRNLADSGDSGSSGSSSSGTSGKKAAGSESKKTTDSSKKSTTGGTADAA
ncbi:FmdB family zinc ribbon protein [Elongatibacter sediminis]|uniref:Zinc ribbon domain-containing protein n=1 Tax=Elongatibacter sediminis TaxID=3119006 RepID=A0AAW9RN34_9GAMM